MNTTFSVHLIGFVLRAKKCESKIALRGPNYCLSRNPRQCCCK